MLLEADAEDSRVARASYITGATIAVDGGRRAVLDRHDAVWAQAHDDPDHVNHQQGAGHV
jgi:hypothetical protein